MLIRAFGLFWRSDEVWPDGRGRSELLGRRGRRLAVVEICNFWRQQGLYVLYNAYGPYYVGLVRQGTLGNRLYSHHFRDGHRGKWDRFSWFGFCGVLGARDEHGLQLLKARPERARGSLYDAIGDIEALLINALGPRANRHFEHLGDAFEWTQVLSDERDDLLARLV